MPRPRTGQIKKRNGKFIARIRWKDQNGRQRSRDRTASTRTEARNLIRVLWSEVEMEKAQQQQAVEPTPEQPRTFADLAETYLAERVTPPVYVGDRKVTGMRAHANIRNEVTPLKHHFGARPITEITYAEIEQYKRLRLAIEKKHGGQRTLAGFNHELRRLRAMFNFAIQKQWLIANPFHHGPSLISAADEIPRDRPRGEKEEERLLAKCTGRRAYLRPIIICAIDTAARLGEILGLRRRDVDLDERLIRLPHTVTKSARERVVPVSDRLAGELRAWLHFLPADPEALVFGGIKSDAVTHLFAKVCRDAGISDLHFHDLRHWATTDIVNALTAAGIAPQHAMAITGHSQEKTFRRYLRTDNSTVKAAGAALEALKAAKSNAKREQKRGQAQSEDPKKPAPVSKLRRIK